VTPIHPAHEASYREAEESYNNAVRRYSAAIESEVARIVLQTYPTARVIEAYGEYGGDSGDMLTLRVRALRDGEGNLLVDWEEPTEEFDAVVEEVDALLDVLHEINPEDFLHEQQFDIAPTDDTVPLSDALVAFFHVEIRNEQEGGVAPATVESALDSFDQAPKYVLASWMDLGEYGAGEMPDHVEHAVDAAGQELRALVRQDPTTELEELL
jgi:hypothetical protein